MHTPHGRTINLLMVAIKRQKQKQKQTQKCTFQVLAWYRHKNVHFKSCLGTDTKMYFPSPGLVQTQKCSISFNNIKSSSISGVNFFSWIFHKICVNVEFTYLFFHSVVFVYCILIFWCSYSEEPSKMFSTCVSN